MFKALIIYQHYDWFGQLTTNIQTNFHFPDPWRQRIKFCSNQPDRFEEMSEVVEMWLWSNTKEWPWPQVLNCSYAHLVGSIYQLLYRSLQLFRKPYQMRTRWIWTLRDQLWLTIFCSPQPLKEPMWFLGCNKHISLGPQWRIYDGP